jgi:hypothetical protein
MRDVTIFFLLCLGLASCSVNDTPTPDDQAIEDGGKIPIQKGKIDLTALRKDAWPVALTGDLATVTVPFSQAVPGWGATDGFGKVRDALEKSVSLLVRSDETNITAALTKGMAVDATPKGPGEFSWKLNAKRKSATITFWNATSDGLTLKSDRTYTVQFTITANDYLETLPSTTFTVQPE